MSIKITRCKTAHICEKTNHYYGSNSNNNDVISIPYGSVWYLRDNPRDLESDYHPHIVIYDRYMDKIGRIATFSITSTPSLENMVPIIFRDSIGYINWHHPINYKVSEFNEYGKFLGIITESESFNVAMTMYSVIYLNVGRLFGMSKQSAIDKYLDYIEEFEERSAYYNNYCHKYQTKADIEKDEKLNLHITFTRSNNVNEHKCDNIEPFTDMIVENPTEDNIEISTDDVDNEPSIDEFRTIIKIDLTSIELKSKLRSIESTATYGQCISLSRNCKDMSDEDIITFFALMKTRGGKKTSMIYGCSEATVWNK